MNIKNTFENHATQITISDYVSCESTVLDKKNNSRQI